MYFFMTVKAWISFPCTVLFDSVIFFCSNHRNEILVYY